jgi:hypothetical protein
MLLQLLVAVSLFLFGVAVGIVLGRRVDVPEIAKEPGVVKFFEPLTVEERFKNAKNIEDLLDLP